MHCHKANASHMPSRQYSDMPRGTKSHGHKGNAKASAFRPLLNHARTPLICIDVRSMPSQCSSHCSITPQVAIRCQAIGRCQGSAPMPLLNHARMPMRCIAIRPMPSQRPQVTAQSCARAHKTHCQEAMPSMCPQASAQSCLKWHNDA
jgi:hypothetical protein